MPENNGVQYSNPPQSRNEAILESIVEGTQYTAPPQSRIEDLLLQIKAVGVGTEVVANPTPTGEETDLVILQVGTQKYFVGSKEVINIKSFGAVGDGETDNSTAFRNAFSKANETGKPLYIPKGVYLLDWGQVRVDLTSLSFSIIGDGKFESILLFKDSHNSGQFGNGIVITNEDEDFRPYLTIKDIGFYYDNDDDSITTFPEESTLIHPYGWFKEILIDNAYFHIGGTATVLPSDTCLFAHIGAETVTVSNCLFENFTGNEVGGCLWLMSSIDEENIFAINQVVVRDNEFRNSNKDEAIAVYTATADTENNLKNVLITNNVIIHKAWTTGKLFRTDAPITVFIGDTSAEVVDGNIVITNNNLYSDLANLELIRTTGFSGVLIAENKLSVSTRYSTGALWVIRIKLGSGIIRDNVFDYSAITEEVALSSNDANVEWLNNSVKGGGNVSISASANSSSYTTKFEGNAIDINSGKMFIIRKSSRCAMLIYNNIVYGNVGFGSLSGTGFILKGNQFNANSGEINDFSLGGGTGASFDYKMNDGCVLKISDTNITTPLASFKYMGRKDQLKFYQSGTEVADSPTVRAAFFTSSDILYIGDSQT